jgi:FAD synthetase
MTRVLAFGTFDIFHPGHEHYLKTAAALGDELYVIVALDETVAQVKGRLPHNSEQHRISAVAALPYVTQALLGRKGDKYAIIKESSPDIIALGYDQTTFVERLEQELAACGLHPRIVRLEGLRPETYKSSKYRKKLDEQRA